MKRLLLSALMALLLAPALRAQQLVFQGDTFLWKQQTIFFQTNNPPPDIDATNIIFANGSEFGVESLPSAFNNFPFTTLDTLNVTNYGLLLGVTGFDFELFPRVPPLPQPGVPFSNMSGTFANLATGLGGGIIECESLSLLGITGLTTADNSLDAVLKVNATNIINTGTVTMDNAGLIDFRGQHLDLRRGTLTMTAGGSAAFGLVGGGSAAFGLLDWGSGGFGTNSGGWLPGVELTPTTAQSATFTNFNNTFIGSMRLLNSTPYVESVTGQANGNVIVWRYIFLQDSSPSNVAHNVYFGGSTAGPGEFHIEWIGTNTDPVTGTSVPTYLYLSDDPAARRPTNYNFTLPPIQPDNPLGSFDLVSSTVQIPSGAPGVPASFPFPWANPNVPLVTNDFAYVTLQVGGAAITNSVVGGSITNVPGRIQLTSSQDLNLANARISVPNYVLLSTPNFQGNTNALISTPLADLYIGVTNGSLTLSNLLNPNVPIWTGVTPAPDAVGDGMGGIQAFSGSFTNVVTNLVLIGGVLTNALTTNDVRILIVNSAVSPSGSCLQQNVQLHAPNNLTISDDLNIFGNFFSDAQVLTIGTNSVGRPGAPNAFSSCGQINLLSPDMLWSPSVPNLQFFTNSGVFSSVNFTAFAGGMTSPLSDPNAATPYQAFINHGNITNGGTFIRTGAFENSGVIDDDFGGSIDIVASGNALATNGEFLSPAGFVSITANSLLASNGIIEAGGGPITLTTPCSLSDGYVFGNQFAHATNAIFPHVVTNGNIWLTSGGIDVPVKPPTADLLGTTITDVAFNHFVGSPIIWPAQDFGPVPQGFGDNLAVGRLILDADVTSVFNFAPPPGVNSSAIYIDSIELQGNATNTDANGNPLSIAIQSGMNVYFAQAIENGVSIAEKLNGKFGAQNTSGGRFFWVSNYAGVFSSTNIQYPDLNTYIFNEALAISPHINSGGPDGTQVTNLFLVNANNPFPIPTNVTYDISVNGPQPCDAGIGSNPGGSQTNSPGPAQTMAHLNFPDAPTSLNGGSNGSTNTPTFNLAAGSYNGLFYDTTAVMPSSSGSFTATVTSKGGYSAKLQLGSKVYSFSGMFDSSGNAVANNVTGKGLPTLSVSLQLVNNDQITGDVSGNGWVAQLLANRAAFTSKAPTPSAGKETVLLALDNDISTTSTGVGFASVTISTSGGVQSSATLPDGVKITQKSALSKDGIWPIYASLYGGKGLLIGWMQCTNQIEIAGSAVWEMPGGAGGFYPGGLTNQIDATGSRIQGTVGFMGKGAAILSGAGLETSLTNKVVVAGKTVLSSDSGLKFSINPQTGLFSGSVTLPNSKQKLSFQGALLEKSGIGGGFFLNADQSGKVYFGPAQ